VSPVSPGVLVSALLVLAVSQLLYAFWPYPRRAYLPVLILTTAGILLGQLWDLLGLPSVRVGSANLLPALIFAVALQPRRFGLPPGDAGELGCHPWLMSFTGRCGMSSRSAIP